MSILRIISAGVTTIQDSGRDGWQQVGVPISGAWNPVLYGEANLLLSGDEEKDVPMFEVLAGTLTFTVDGDPVHFAVVGNATLTIDGHPMPTGALLTTQRPHHHPVNVAVHHTGAGVAYVAVAGINVPDTLGSVATDTFSYLGPNPVKTGDEFLLDTDSLPGNVGKFLRPAVTALPTPIRVISHDAADEFFATTWTVQVSSRSGTRLTSSTPLALPDTAARPSHPVVPGTIQVPPSGEPIILGPDSGVTGGYPTVGTIITADLPRVAALPVGSSISFQSCTVEAAMMEYMRMLTRMSNATIDISYVQQMTSKRPKASKKTKGHDDD